MDVNNMQLYTLLMLELLDVLPVATLYAIYGFLLYVSMLICYPFLLLYRLSQKQVTEKKSFAIIRWMKKATDSIVFILYGDLANNRVRSFLKEESIHGVGSLDDVWKRVQLMWFALMLRLNALSLILLCGLAFWDRFLVQRSRVCEDEKVWQCYIGTLDAVNGWGREPLVNCSNMTDADEVVCFKFAYNVADTVGLVGGVLSFGIYCMRLGGTVMTFLYKQLQRCCSKKVYRVFSSIIQQTPIWIMLISAVISIIFLKYRDLTFYGELIETFGIASTLALVLATPWSAFVDYPDTKPCSNEDSEMRKVVKPFAFESIEGEKTVTAA